MKISLKHYNRLKCLAIGVFTLFLPNLLFAEGCPAKPSELSSDMARILLVIIIALLVVIAMLARAVVNAASGTIIKMKGGKMLSVIAFLVIGTTGAFAATESAQQLGAMQVGLSSGSFLILALVIVLEFIVIFYLISSLNAILGKAVSKEHAKVGGFMAFWNTINRFQSATEEQELDMGHAYDGIREFDNKLPSWWLWGSYVCIIVAVIYLWQYHVAKTKPLSAEEYVIALQQAKAEQDAYLAKSGNAIDENNAVLLTDAADLTAAKQIFTTICSACHLADGGGLVGPNLTDDYWLHGCDVKDIFKTIKYGVPDKGMQSWQSTYSPKQIEQLASYVKSLHGTKPAKPKAPQGVLCTSK